MNSTTNKIYHSPFNITVLVAGIGFFIDAFDLFLFNVYRIPSLKDLGLSGSELTLAGEKLLSIQMAGMSWVVSSRVCMPIRRAV